VEGQGRPPRKRPLTCLRVHLLEGQQRPPRLRHSRTLYDALVEGQERTPRLRRSKMHQDIRNTAVEFTSWKANKCLRGSGSQQTSETSSGWAEEGLRGNVPRFAVEFPSTKSRKYLRGSGSQRYAKTSSRIDGRESPEEASFILMPRVPRSEPTNASGTPAIEEKRRDPRGWPSKAPEEM
jgi:hypothetical protein